MSLVSVVVVVVVPDGVVVVVVSVVVKVRPELQSLTISVIVTVMTEGQVDGLTVTVTIEIVVTVEYIMIVTGGGHTGVTVIISILVHVSKTVNGTQSLYPALQIPAIPKNRAAIETRFIVC